MMSQNGDLTLLIFTGNFEARINGVLNREFNNSSNNTSCG